MLLNLLPQVPAERTILDYNFFERNYARKSFQSIIKLDLKAVSSLFLFDKNTPKYLYFSTDAFDGKETKAGKRAGIYGICKGKYYTRFLSSQKSKYLSAIVKW